MTNKPTNWADMGEALKDRRIKITWSQLVEIETRLEDVLQQARAVRDPGGVAFCANAVWYGRSKNYPNFKELINSLAGWEAGSKNPLIRTPEAYDLAYQTVYNVLPACRNCLCF